MLVAAFLKSLPHIHICSIQVLIGKGPEFKGWEVVRLHCSANAVSGPPTVPAHRQLAARKRRGVIIVW